MDVVAGILPAGNVVALLGWVCTTVGDDDGSLDGSSPVVLPCLQQPAPATSTTKNVPAKRLDPSMTNPPV